MTAAGTVKPKIFPPLGAVAAPPTVTISVEELQRQVDMRTLHGNRKPLLRPPQARYSATRRRIYPRPPFGGMAALQHRAHRRLPRRTPSSRTGSALLARVASVSVETAEMPFHEVLSPPMHDRKPMARYANLTVLPTPSALREESRRSPNIRRIDWRVDADYVAVEVDCWLLLHQQVPIRFSHLFSMKENNCLTARKDEIPIASPDKMSLKKSAPVTS
jgi:hypothetical protein